MGKALKLIQMGELALGCCQGEGFSSEMLPLGRYFPQPHCTSFFSSNACVFWNELLNEKNLYLGSQSLVLLWVGHPFLDQTEWVVKDMWY